MRDFKERIERLLSDANDFDLIGNLAADANKRASFRRLAEKFRIIAVQLKSEMDGSAPMPPVSDSAFLLSQAKNFRDLAAAIQEESIRAGLLRMAAEFEGLAAREA